MSDAGQITVELIAKLDQLNAGLGEAVSAIKDATGQMKDAMEGVGEGSDRLKEKTETALNAGIFLEYEEIAKQALEAVEQAFDHTAGKAQEFGLATAKFAAMMGTSTEHAAGLEAALNSVGVSLDEYEQVAMRMEMRLKSQEGEFRALGMATRDQSGNLLQGEELMQSAIKTMQQYKLGTDQNEFALQVFGRRAQQVYDIMRADNVVQQQFTDDMKALGVNLGDTSESAVEQEAALGRLKQMWTDLEIAIGQKLMPVMTEFFHWMHDVGLPELQQVGSVVAFLVDTFVWLATTIDQIASAIAAPLAVMTDALIGFGKIAYDVLTLHFSDISGDAKVAWDTMKSDWKQALDEMAADTKAYAATHEALYGAHKDDLKGGVFDDPSKHGNRSFVPFNQEASQQARQLATEKIEGAEKTALEEIKIEEGKNETLLKMGQVTLDAYLAQARALEDRKYQIQQEALEKKLALDKRAEQEAPAGQQGYAQAAAARLQQQKDKDQLELLEKQHQEALSKIDEKGVQDREKLEQQATEQYVTDLNDRLKNGMAEIEEEYKQHLISYQERDQLEQQLTSSIYEQELQRLDSEMSTLDKGTQAWNDAHKKRDKTAQDFYKEMQRLQAQTTADDQKQWDTLTNSIKGTFNSALNGMILGTTSWQKAIGQIVDSVANSFLQMGEKILEDWIETQITKELFTKASDTTAAVGQIQAAAGVAAANTFASVAAIPVVGPELAPAAADGAMATVLSYESLALAEQGMLLDRDRLVFAHKDEQILPAHISKGMQELIRGGGRNSDVNLHYSPTVNAPEHRSLGQLLTDESSTMLAWLNARMRDGSLKARA